MKINSVVPENTCCDMRDSWNIISKLSSDFWVIVHGPGWCENEFSFKNNFRAKSFSTNLNEMDIVLWTWYDKLLDLVIQILEKNKEIKVLYILWTCSSELIWDDIDNISNHFIGQDIKIIPLHTSWMRWTGYHYTKYNVFLSLFDEFIELESKKSEKSVNIFFQDGMQNDDVREEIISFLALFWIKVNSFLNSNISLEEIKNIWNVSKNYLIWRDKDFVEMLKYIDKKYNISYSVLDLTLGLTAINKFYSQIYFDFFQDKKTYVLEFLKYSENINKSTNKEKVQSIFSKNFFYTNSKEYSNLLNYFNINFADFPDWIIKDDFINTSHKFNFSNKIIISDNLLSWEISSKIFSSKNFSTLNKYMWFIWIKNFYEDLINQKAYSNFINRYNNYL